MSSLSANLQFVFGILLALGQPLLLHRAWYRLPIGEFLFLFVVDQFMMYYFFILPPKSMEKEAGDGEERRWSEEEFVALKNALQEIESDMPTATKQDEKNHLKRS